MDSRTNDALVGTTVETALDRAIAVATDDEKHRELDAIIDTMRMEMTFKNVAVVESDDDQSDENESDKDDEEDDDESDENESDEDDEEDDDGEDDVSENIVVRRYRDVVYDDGRLVFCTLNCKRCRRHVEIVKESNEASRRWRFEAFAGEESDRVAMALADSIVGDADWPNVPLNDERAASMSSNAAAMHRAVERALRDRMYTTNDEESDWIEPPTYIERPMGAIPIIRYFNDRASELRARNFFAYPAQFDNGVNGRYLRLDLQWWNVVATFAYAVYLAVEHYADLVRSLLIEAGDNVAKYYSRAMTDGVFPGSAWERFADAFNGVDDDDNEASDESDWRSSSSNYDDDKVSDEELSSSHTSDEDYADVPAHDDDDNFYHRPICRMTCHVCDGALRKSKGDRQFDADAATTKRAIGVGRSLRPLIDAMWPVIDAVVMEGKPVPDDGDESLAASAMRSTVEQALREYNLFSADDTPRSFDTDEAAMRFVAKAFRDIYYRAMDRYRTEDDRALLDPRWWNVVATYAYVVWLAARFTFTDLSLPYSMLDEAGRFVGEHYADIVGDATTGRGWRTFIDARCGR